jgi:hypothetical protein
MNEAQKSMYNFGVDVDWWPDNQVALTFHSPLVFTPENKQPIIDSMHLDDINRFLGEKIQLTLKSFEDKDISRPSKEEETSESLVDKGFERLGEAIEGLGEAVEGLGEKLIDHAEKEEGGSSGDGSSEQDDDDHPGLGLNDSRGKYLFPSPDPNKPGSTLNTFFNIEPTTGRAGVDRTVDVVNLINTTPFITGSLGEQIKLPSASPNWFGGGTDYVHGCPAVPPMPVPTDSSCTSGESQIRFQDLNEEMQSRLGKGVRVLILDTIPSPKVITSASNDANPQGGIARNLLLKEMATNMQSTNKFNVDSSLNADPPAISVYYQSLADELEGADAPRTGKDINHQLVGYEIPDHGLFVAGIIRTLAPQSQIECVRLLNDFGVNTLSTLIQVLEVIVTRMTTGDLRNMPVVINLSLVMTPYDDMFSGLGFKTQDDLQQNIDLRDALNVIKNLVSLGAVIVAAAGNDSYSREMPDRMGPRHPAAYPEVVAVAAVTGKDNETEAASYSNRADPVHGIATYGGGIATPVNPQTPGLPVAPTPTNCMTGATNIDAHIGVYTSLTYPRLVSPEPPNIPGDCNETYPASQPDSYWAYWSGTSFSTPIISALVARILEKMGPGAKLSSQQVITTINSPAVITDSPLPLNTDLQALVLDVGQCQDGGVIEK